jgi:hypothetical protein
MNNDPTVATEASWPSFEREGDWPKTHDTLHLVLQMLGKLRVALAPPLPEWAHTSLALTPRGLTTGIAPWGHGSVEAQLDLIDAAVRVITSDGRTRSTPLVPAVPIATTWAWFTGALREAGITAELWDKPQERKDVTPFSKDTRPRVFDPSLARSWFALLTELQGIFDEWRSPFFGRSSVSFWWGGFDFTVVLFNGRHAQPPQKSDYIMRYDLDAEHVSLGFWPGDQKHEAMFFGYVVPEPPNCEVFPIDVSTAGWAQAMGEWVLPYRAVRDAPDRHAALRGFMDSVLRAASELGGWDLDSMTYVAPRK